MTGNITETLSQLSACNFDRNVPTTSSTCETTHNADCVHTLRSELFESLCESLSRELAELRVLIRRKDHPAALALVTADQDHDVQSQSKDDADLRRVTDFLDLHENVKVRYDRAQDAGLQQARTMVASVLHKLEQPQVKR